MRAQNGSGGNPHDFSVCRREAMDEESSRDASGEELGRKFGIGRDGNDTKVRRKGRRRVESGKESQEPARE